MKNDAFKILTGFFIGAMGGLLTGLLIAPDSGKGTRKKISDTAHKLQNDLHDFAEGALEATKKSISETVDELVKGHKQEDQATLKN
ncbi:MAG: YtxH domain-containing protein [Cytophagales bacterium]|nr:YtxH domain-containing protein [Cytophagales bacterium]